MYQLTLTLLIRFAEFPKGTRRDVPRCFLGDTSSTPTEGTGTAPHLVVTSG